MGNRSKMSLSLPSPTLALHRPRHVNAKSVTVRSLATNTIRKEPRGSERSGVLRVTGAAGVIDTLNFAGAQSVTVSETGVATINTDTTTASDLETLLTADDDIGERDMNDLGEVRFNSLLGAGFLANTAGNGVHSFAGNLALGFGARRARTNVSAIGYNVFQQVGVNQTGDTPSSMIMGVDNAGVSNSSVAGRDNTFGTGTTAFGSFNGAAGVGSVCLLGTNVVPLGAAASGIGANCTPSANSLCIGADTLDDAAHTGTVVIGEGSGDNGLIVGANSSAEAAADVTQCVLGPGTTSRTGSSTMLHTNVCWQHGTVNTTDATPTAVATFPLTSNTDSVLIRAFVTGRRTNSTAITFGAYSETFHARNKSGTVTISPASPSFTAQDPDTSGWSVAANVSGTSVRVVATGGASDNVTWIAVLEVTSIF